MIYLLDTNAISEIAKNPTSLTAQRYFENAHVCVTSVIVSCEVLVGLASNPKSKLAKEMLRLLDVLKVLAFEQPADEAYGRMTAKLMRDGNIIGQRDLFIGAHALSLGLTVVTANEREFSRIPGLNVENWTRPY